MAASGEQESSVGGTAQVAVVHQYGAAGFWAVGDAVVPSAATVGPASVLAGADCSLCRGLCCRLLLPLLLLPLLLHPRHQRPLSTHLSAQSAQSERCACCGLLWEITTSARRGGVESVACRQTECERAARRGGRAASTANHGTLVAAAVHSSRAVDWILHRPLLGILIPTFSVGI